MDDLESMGNSAKLRDLGLEWSDKVVKEFMEKVGKNHKAEERALFYMTLGSDLLARMYAEVHKDFAAQHGEKVGVQVAQKLLETSFSLTSMLLRKHGEDVHVGVKVDFANVANPKTVALPVSDKCECSLDVDGRCTSCAKMFRTFLTKMRESIEIMQSKDLQIEKICHPCAPRYMDEALARIVREDLSKFPKEAGEAMMNALFMASQNLQAMPMPLTKKAWSDLQS